MKLFVTGGCGFIGSNFVRYILENYSEDEIVVYDKLTYAGRPENIADCFDQYGRRLALEQGDISDFARVSSIIEQYRPHAIVSFAAATHVDRSIHEGNREFVMSNAVGVQTLLDVVNKYQLEKMVQVSTDEVYGSLELNEERSFHEDTPFAPNMPYAAAKAGGDLLCRASYVTYGTPVCVTHCSNNYGPYQFPEKLIPFAIMHALADEPVPIYGDGLNVRDWIHVRDHATAIDLVLRRGQAGETYNIGSDNERDNLTVIRMLLDVLEKSESLITFVPDRPGHDRRYAIDATKIKTVLAWEPEYPRARFREGLVQTVQWYLEHEDWLSKIRGAKIELNTHIKV